MKTIYAVALAGVVSLLAINGSMAQADSGQTGGNAAGQGAGSQAGGGGAGGAGGSKRSYVTSAAALVTFSPPSPEPKTPCISNPAHRPSQCPCGACAD
jgi:hypothetical protein